MNGNTMFSAIAQEAHLAGYAAGQACNPTPMMVREADLMTDQPLAGGRSYYVPDGVCGFAYIKFNGNTAWGRWALGTGIARKDYPKGLAISVQAFGQSMQRKEAYAQAYVAVLKKHGIDAYADSRID